MNVGCNILISNQVGVISILKNISQNNIIINNEDENEIANKILWLYKNKNKKQTYIKRIEDFTWNNASKKLIQECKRSLNVKNQ